ncbi:MAG: preprotein translocase subunit YajC [Paraprevotella sp.]|jgi:preprotein translocase, yajC subunit|nr:preprotein translocase subunit YajC [Paraprevotella sp.]MBP3471634.1 preprotein translocase subunit YajC [Paraprevotella sp.]
MTTMTILLQAAANGGGMSMIIMMVIIFAIMWIFMIRPQQKKQKEIQKFRNNLTVGTTVITSGGIYGKVKSIDETENVILLEVAKGVEVRVDRNCVYASQQDTLMAGK